jgi:TATA-box binding protein (TBP) (component of TFIID and TFIIIB)
MKVTHILQKFKITSEFSLDQFMKEDVTDITFKKSPFTLVEWRQHRGVALVYKAGAVVCHGFNTEEYYSHLLALGYSLSPVKLITKSAVYKLKGTIKYSTLVRDFNFQYFPDLFHGSTRYLDNLHFIIYHTGTVLVTGLRTEEDEIKALDFLLQIELSNGDVV